MMSGIVKRGKRLTLRYRSYPSCCDEDHCPRLEHRLLSCFLRSLYEAARPRRKPHLDCSLWIAVYELELQHWVCSFCYRFLSSKHYLSAMALERLEVKDRLEQEGIENIFAYK